MTIDGTVVPEVVSPNMLRKEKACLKKATRGSQVGVPMAWKSSLEK